MLQLRIVSFYGNPGITISFYSKGYCLDWNELNAESILRIYGYSVSETEGLTSKTRQEILAELVDLEITTVSFITKMISFFIKSHPDDRFFIARTKWEEDLHYIENYKIRPERFLILDTKKVVQHMSFSKNNWIE